MEDTWAGYERERVGPLGKDELKKADESPEVRSAHNIVAGELKELEERMRYGTELHDLWDRFTPLSNKIALLRDQLPSEQAEAVHESLGSIWEGVKSLESRYRGKQIDLATCRAEYEGYISDLEFLLAHKRPDGMHGDRDAATPERTAGNDHAEAVPRVVDEAQPRKHPERPEAYDLADSFHKVEDDYADLVHRMTRVLEQLPKHRRKEFQSKFDELKEKHDAFVRDVAADYNTDMRTIDLKPQLVPVGEWKKIIREVEVSLQELLGLYTDALHGRSTRTRSIDKVKEHTYATRIHTRTD